jgi:hypothetical protein
MGRTSLRLFGAGAGLAALAPATALAHGLSDEFVAAVTTVIVALHTASIAGAIFCLRRHRSWPVAALAVLVGAAAAIAWWFGFLKFAKSPAAATLDWELLFWVWLLAPFAVLVLSGGGLLLRHYTKRAI